MGFKRFSLLLAARFGLLLLTLTMLGYALISKGYHATALLISILLIFQVTEVLRFISKTNAELTRFFEAARYADFSQRFNLNALGSGFGELGEAFDDILERFETVRSDQEQALRHLKAMIEHVPVPLMSIHNNGQLTLWNNGARRLFGTHKVSRVENLQQFGGAFANEVVTIKPGEQRLAVFSVDGMEQQLAISATQILMTGKQDMLLSMQNIQSELDSAQLQAWQDLVRVLTHEIMNSITPVSSLAKTAVDLVEDIQRKFGDNSALHSELSDVANAVQTVARRSEGLTQFVSSYRRLTRLPPPTKKTVKISALFQQVTALATQGWQEKGITLDSHIAPEELDINVDVDMLEQLLINLLKNAEQALQNTDKPTVKLQAFLNPRGHAVIAIGDNGEGVAAEIAEKIFVPFFTTKRDGSGVGLALTRQVMVLHGGSVKLTRSELGGAQFNLTF